MKDSFIGNGDVSDFIADADAKTEKSIFKHNNNEHRTDGEPTIWNQ